MAIMSSAPPSRTPSSSSTKSSPPSCATNWSPTTSPTSVLRRDWTISMPFASASKPSPPASPVSRRNGSTPAFAGAGNVDFPLLQRLALPITIGAVRYPGIKIHNPRVIRLLEVLLHGGSHIGGWTTKHIHHAVLTTFPLSDRAYGLNQLRYDLRKLKGHGLVQRDASRYAYRLTPKGVHVALLFLFFHKRLCGPLANSRFHHRPDARHQPVSKLEAVYHHADKPIQQIVDLIAA